MSDNLADVAKIVASIVAGIGVVLGGGRLAKRSAEKSADRTSRRRRDDPQGNILMSTQQIMKYVQDEVARAVSEERKTAEERTRYMVSRAVDDAVGPVMDWVRRIRNGVVEYIDSVEEWASHPTQPPPASEHVRKLLEEEPPLDDTRPPAPTP